MTPEAKRRKNQKKKQKQKQKKQAEKLAVEDPVTEQSQDDSVESADVLSQSVDESDMNTTTTSAPLEDETDHPDVTELKGSPEHMEIIRSLQLDTGTSIQGQLENKLSHEGTIIDDVPKSESQEDVNVVEADHNVAVPKDDTPRPAGPPVGTPVEPANDLGRSQSVGPSVNATLLDSCTPDDSIKAEEAMVSGIEDRADATGLPEEHVEGESTTQTALPPSEVVQASDQVDGSAQDTPVIPDAAEQLPQHTSEVEVSSENVVPEVEHPSLPPENVSFFPDTDNGSSEINELFPDGKQVETLPWEVENEEGNPNSTSPTEESQVAALFGDDANGEVLPWETSGVEAPNHLESNKASSGPIESESLEASSTTEKSNKNDETTIRDILDPSKETFTPVFDEESDETVSRPDDRLRGHGNSSSIETDEKGSLSKDRDSFPSDSLDNSKPAQTSAKQDQEADKLAAIFDDEAEDSTSWLNEEHQEDVVPSTSQTPEPEQIKVEAKFSFLQEDDDLLDEEEDDFLPSDDEDIANEKIMNESSDAANGSSTFNMAPNAEHPKPPPEAARFTPSVTSVQSNGSTSRYEPVQYPTNQDNAYLPSGHNAPSHYGIATPQFALQSSLPTQAPNVRQNQEAVEKINEEKKKSDAYDFPLDLFPEKKNIVHAKPVRVPTFAAGSSQQLPNRVPPSTVNQDDVRRSASSKSSFEAPLPKNPYASLVTPPGKETAAPQFPVQGSILPTTALPPIGSIGSSQNIPQSGNAQYPAINSYMPDPRSRGYSNVSTGGLSSKSTDIPVPNTSMPFPPPSRKASAKYAPTSPAQASYPTAPGRGKVFSASPVNAPSFGGLASTNAQGVLPPIHFGGLPSAHAQTNMPPIPYGSLPSANANSVQNAKVMPPALSVPDPLPPSNVLSPVSASSTRRFHARSNSSVYTPNQNEYTSKYAPTVHPQYQNPVPMPPTANHDPTFQPAFGRSIRRESLASRVVPAAVVPEKPIDNQALLNRQFPLINWSVSDKMVYAIPTEAAANSYLMGQSSSLQSLEVTRVDSKTSGSNILKSFPGPLIKNKAKKKDVDKWLETSLCEYADSSLEYTVLSILRLKLAESNDWKGVARCLYNSDELLSYLSQPLIDTKPKPVTPKLDAGAQLRVLAFLQTGGRERALEIAMEKGDYAMALLIGSLMGKNKWAEVVQSYLNNEFYVDSDVSHFSINLLSLVFQVFIGNSKEAIQEFYTDRLKGEWAADNWRIIVAAVLSNIEASNERLTDGEVPPVISEFLVEYGIFLTQRGLGAEACIVFLIANLPLSSLPIANAPVKFEQIGGPMSLEGCMFSEVYEFVSCPDVKGYQSLYLQKLYHAFCLQEHGLFSAASRYVDHLTGLLKHFPKKDPAAVQIAHGLNELSSRLAGSSTGWLGKPTLSSVWGQLDKSFNKYIGGDDDSLIKKSQGKKVFDGFTPVASRNSSMLNVSQYQFTPAHKQAQHQTFKSEQNALLAPMTANPVDNSLQAQSGKNQLSKSLTDQGPPPTISPYSVNSSPQQQDYQGSHSTVAYHYPLRRVQTDQTGGTKLVEHTSLIAESTDTGNKDVSSAAGDPFYQPSNVPTPLVPISRVSPHSSSTPDLLRERSEVLTDRQLTTEAPLQQSRLRRPSSKPFDTDLMSVQSQTNLVGTNRGPDFMPSTQKEKIPYKQHNYSQVSITGFERMVEGTYGSKPIEPIEPIETPTNRTNGVSSMEEEQDTTNNGYEPPNNKANSSVLHHDIYNQTPLDTSIEMRGTDPIIGSDNLETRKSKQYSDQDPYRDPEDDKESGTGYVPSDQFNHGLSSVHTTMEAKKAEGGQRTAEHENEKHTSEAPFSPNLKTELLSHAKTNPYAPPLGSNLYERPLEAGIPAVDGPVKTSVYALNEKADDNKDEDMPSKAVRNASPVVSTPAEESTARMPVNRFDPIKPPEALTADIFEPVIKKAAASSSFAPLVVQSSEDQYDDIVEDESDDEDEEEQKRQREKEEQEKRKKEEEEKKRREKEKAEAKKAKQKQDEKANGWFSWLKKDPNEKKPIKAKLGHKSTFYYDEKLKRWVNKDASEEEKQKVATPPPPPPVVKRMDNGPKTKPVPRPEAQMKDTFGAILPKNPITGAPLESSPVAPQGLVGAPPVSPTAINHSGINLSGKKANGLDDLLSLTGNNNVASKRKRKPARGYVNVMDNK